MTELVRLAKVNQVDSAGNVIASTAFPIQRSTFYKWRTTKKHPELFVKVGGATFIDRVRWDQLVEKSRNK